MADRMLNQFAATFEKAVVTIFGDVTIGGTGAPTLVAAKSKGIKSIVRNSAGDYTVTFQDKYNKFLGLAVSSIKATAPAAPLMSIKAVSVNAAGGATVEFVLYTAAAGTAATDPASGEELLIEASFGNSAAF